MADPQPSLNLLFHKGDPPAAGLREAILEREPGLLAEYPVHPPADPRTAEVESALSEILLRHEGPVRVVLAGFAADEAIPPRLLPILGSRRVEAVERVESWDGHRTFHDHRPLADVKSRVLMVFPGPIIPLVMGSHRRAFQLVANLAAQGCPVDLLITGSEAALNAAKPLLHQISPRVSHFKNRRPQLPPSLRWRKRLERSLRVVLGTRRPPPDLFEERHAVGASFSGCKALRRLVEGGHYRAVIVNYAWLANIRRLLTPSEMAGISWICDTHDVQFVRNATDNQRERRFFRSEEREKQCELRVLDSFDKVLAISEPDAASLRAGLGGDKVIFTPTGFDYALGEPHAPHPEAPVFGFIGRLMRANEKALGEILRDWWPAIHRRWPAARLHLAGTICDCRLAAEAAGRDGVVLDRFVADLATWYRSLDVMLNPVMVQGGMNFKSLEALMAGKLLLTNRLGSSCLGREEFATLAETGAEAVTALERELANPDFLADRRRIRDEVRGIFGDARANHGLLEHLRGAVSRKPAPPAVSRPQRVLIQCGDHLENRIRVSALARGIRERGHRPVALVYSPELVAPFLALGIDAVAIQDFEGPPADKLRRATQARQIRGLDTDYRGFHLDDVAAMWQMQKPESFTPERRAKTVEQMLRHIDRCAAMLDHVQPDQLIVWNGHTGWVANVLRHHARRHGLPRYFLERSIFPDGVFVDPAGTNGNSELSHLDASELATTATAPASRPLAPFQTPAPAARIAELRQAGPWRDARKIIFLPLQVQSDTNILLHSPVWHTMAGFVTGVHRAYGGPGVAIVVRPHPEETATDLALPELPGVHVDSHGRLGDWIDAADLVVTINSTVGMEALFKRKPVRAYGHGIYTGKGFTAEEIPDEARLGKFWDVLVQRHTATPDHPFPDCLAATLPPVTGTPPAPRNAAGLDPDTCQRAATEFRETLRETALAAGSLAVPTGHLGTSITLDLNYRQTRAAFDEAAFAARVRATLGLPATVEIRCDATADPAAGPRFDKYGWVVAAPPQPAP